MISTPLNIQGKGEGEGMLVHLLFRLFQVLCGELLRQAQDLIEQRIHPQVR